MLWLLQVYPLKVAKNENHCMVVKRKSSQNCGIRTHCMIVTTKSSQSCRIWMPLYVSYKKSVSKLRNMNTIAELLKGNRLKVAEYEYHCMVVTRKSYQSCAIWTPLYLHGRKSPQSCGIRIPLYGIYKESVSKLRNINTIVCSLQGNRLKVAEYECHCMVFTRKSSRSCGIQIPPYGSYKESV